MKPLAVSLVLVALVSACAVDPAEPQRDYTLASCPGRVERESSGVCDRGVGYVPRFVTVGQCFADLGAPDSSVRVIAHPAADRCRVETRIILVRWDDVRIEIGR